MVQTHEQKSYFLCVTEQKLLIPSYTLPQIQNCLWLPNDVGKEIQFAHPPSGEKIYRVWEKQQRRFANITVKCVFMYFIVKWTSESVGSI